MRNFIVILILFPLTCFSQLEGKVVSIADGDTFTMLVNNTQIKVRLHGIDCPEKGQDYGDAARKFLSVMIAGETVKVVEMGKDRYGRTIGIAFINDINLNEVLLQKGLAWHYKKYDSNPKWALLEEAARMAGLNLWSMPNPIPPWEWRKSKKL